MATGAAVVAPDFDLVSSSGILTAIVDLPACEALVVRINMVARVLEIKGQRQFRGPRDGRLVFSTSGGGAVAGARPFVCQIGLPSSFVPAPEAGLDAEYTAGVLRVAMLEQVPRPRKVMRVTFEPRRVSADLRADLWRDDEAVPPSAVLPRTGDAVAVASGASNAVAISANQGVVREPLLAVGAGAPDGTTDETPANATTATALALAAAKPAPEIREEPTAFGREDADLDQSPPLAVVREPVAVDAEALSSSWDTAETNRAHSARPNIAGAVHVLPAIDFVDKERSGGDRKTQIEASAAPRTMLGEPASAADVNESAASWEVSPVPSEASTGSGPSDGVEAASFPLASLSSNTSDAGDEDGADGDGLNTPPLRVELLQSPREEGGTDDGPESPTTPATGKSSHRELVSLGSGFFGGSLRNLIGGSPTAAEEATGVSPGGAGQPGELNDHDPISLFAVDGDTSAATPSTQGRFRSPEELRSDPLKRQASLSPPQTARCPECGEALDTGGDVVEALGELWHAACFKCTACKKLLVDGFVAHDGSPFCPQDYAKVFGTRCAGCALPITDQTALSVNGQVYHHDCLPAAAGKIVQSPDGQHFLLPDDGGASFSQ